MAIHILEIVNSYQMDVKSFILQPKRFIMKRIFSTLLCFVVALGIESTACTNLIVGPKASVDGSTIVSYAADSYYMYGWLYHYPAATYPKGAKLPIYEWDTGKYLGSIKQARETYNVVGNMNQYQVTIGETTFGGRPELADSTGVMDYGSLIYVALQRSKSAREAIHVMTSLVEEYGYYSSGESFTIADPTEAWIMEMIGKGPGVRGAVWVARRVPDDCISAHANQSRIRQFPLDDKDNCLYASDVISFAREKGYFNGLNKDFSFADAYAPLDFGALRYCEARVWSFYNRFTKRGEEFLPYIYGKDKTPMPLFIKPDRKLSVRDVQNMMRDHYEGTPLAINEDLGAGPWKMPYRPSPLHFKVDGKEYFNERPISTQQTGFVFVAQMREDLPDPIGGVLWFGLDDANMTVFTPVYCCTNRIPKCYQENGLDLATFSMESSFWVYNWVSNMVYPRYSLMIGDLKKVQKNLEDQFAATQSAIETQALAYYQKDHKQAVDFLTNYTGQMASATHDTWRKLGNYLIVKYNDMVVQPTDSTGHFKYNKQGRPAAPVRPGYAESFLKEYVKATGDRYLVPQEKKEETK